MVLQQRLDEALDKEKVKKFFSFLLCNELVMLHENKCIYGGCIKSGLIALHTSGVI